MNRYEKTDLSGARCLVARLNEAQRILSHPELEAVAEITWLCSRIETVESSRDLLISEIISLRKSLAYCERLASQRGAIEGAKNSQLPTKEKAS